jgi:hypothetical protein
MAGFDDGIVRFFSLRTNEFVGTCQLNQDFGVSYIKSIPET